MTNNDELNAMMEEFKKAVMRHRNVELLLRAVNREVKIGGMERTIYFASKDVIVALTKYEAAAWNEVARVSELYTQTVTTEALRQYDESQAESQRKITSVAVAIPVKPRIQREPKTGEARITRAKKPTATVQEEAKPVVKRQYNRRNGTK